MALLLCKQRTLFCLYGDRLLLAVCEIYRQSESDSKEGEANCCLDRPNHLDIVAL